MHFGTLSASQVAHDDNYTLENRLRLLWDNVVAVYGIKKPSFFSADAVKRKSISQTLLADAYLAAAGRFTADGILRRGMAASILADAIRMRTYAPTYAADAVIMRAISGTSTLDAYISAFTAYSFTADGILRKVQAASLTADAVLLTSVTHAETWFFGDDITPAAFPFFMGDMDG